MCPVEKRGFLGNEAKKWINECREKYKNWFSLFDELNEYSVEILFKINPHKNNNKELLVSALFAKNLEIYEGIILELERGAILPSQILLRSMIEAFFSMKALANDEEFLKKYISDDLFKRKKIIKAHKDWSEKFLNKSSDLEEYLKEVEESIKKEKVVALDTRKIAIAAGLEDWYLSVWTVLCKDVHSGSRVIDQYIKLNDKGDLETLMWGPGFKKEINLIFETMTRTMLESVECIFGVFSLEEINKDLLQVLKSKYNELSK